MCMAGEEPRGLQYQIGTDLLCFIASLSVWGKLSCNIILKYMLDVWEMLSECHNFWLSLKKKEKKKPTDQNSRAKKSEWEVYVCLSGCLTLFVCLSFFLDCSDSSHSPSGNILCIDWRVLLMSWQQAQLTHIHLGRLGDTHTHTYTLKLVLCIWRVPPCESTIEDKIWCLRIWAFG